MDDQYYIDCIIEGKRLYTRMLGCARGLKLHSGEIAWLESEPRGGVEYIFDINLTTGNVAERAKEMMAAIQQGRLPGYILISTLSQPRNLAELFQANGFHVNLDDGSGMAMDLTGAVQDYQVPAALQIMPVRDEKALAVWVELANRTLFGRDLISYEQYLDMYQLANVTMNLGFVDGVPAATSLVVDGDQNPLATVELVSTQPEYRCRGLGTAITMVSLQQMQRRGVKTAVMHATKAGEPIYRKIGFKSYFTLIEVFWPG